MDEEKQPFISKRLSAGLGLLLLVASMSWIFFYHECKGGGAMGGWYKDCSCRGIERIDFDKTAADGAIRTVCFGRVTARTCYRDRGGFEVPCDEIKQ